MALDDGLLKQGHWRQASHQRNESFEETPEKLRITLTRSDTVKITFEITN